MQKIETYELITLHERLGKLAKKNMNASGVRIKIKYFGDPVQEIGELDFQGEMLPQLIPLLIASIEQTLIVRRSMANSELAGINGVLPKQGG